MNREQIDKAFREWAASSNIAFGDGKSFAAGWEAALRSLESAEPVAKVTSAVNGSYSAKVQVRWLGVMPEVGMKLYASAPAAAPEAVSVPVEPTEAQIAAGISAVIDVKKITGSDSAMADTVYRAMLAAAKEGKHD